MSEGMKVLDDRKYSKDHEYAKLEGDLVVVGITDYAQHSLHEITYVEIKEVGTKVNTGDECGLVESMKASSDIFSPLSGEIVEVNSHLEDAPEVVNEDPYNKGWLFKIKPSNVDEDLEGLMDSKEYSEYISSL